MALGLIPVEPGSCMHTHRSGAHAFFRGFAFETDIGVGKVIKGWDEGLLYSHVANPLLGSCNPTFRGTKSQAHHQSKIRTCHGLRTRHPVYISI